MIQQQKMIYLNLFEYQKTLKTNASWFEIHVFYNWVELPDIGIKHFSTQSFLH